MLFHVTWEFLNRSEDAQKRGLSLFSSWQPPQEVEFKGFWGTADGNGGVALVEAATAADLARTTAPWTPFLRFTVTPLVPIEESSQISGAAVQWRESTT